MCLIGLKALNPFIYKGFDLIFNGGIVKFVVQKCCIMDKFLLYIPLDEYLAQWFINNQGGQVPVTLTRGSVESKILEVFLTKRPECMLPDISTQGKVPVIIPEFRNRPPQTYNHLPCHAMNQLRSCIRQRFDIALWKDLSDFGNIIRNRQDDLIYAWMEKNGIEMSEKNWNAIAKRYQRQRKIYSDRNRSKKKY